MINALYELLGPKAKEIADIWDRSGMVRVHHSWGPNAANLTGEERAQVLLDLENAPKTPKIQFDIDLDKRE
jgi:hypothetical protein